VKLLLIVIYVFIQLYYKDLKVDCKAMWGSIRPEKMITNKKRSNFEKKNKVLTCTANCTTSSLQYNK